MEFARTHFLLHYQHIVQWANLRLDVVELDPQNQDTCKIGARLPPLDAVCSEALQPSSQTWFLCSVQLLLDLLILMMMIMMIMMMIMIMMIMMMIMMVMMVMIMIMMIDHGSWSWCRWWYCAWPILAHNCSLFFCCQTFVRWCWYQNHLTPASSGSPNWCSNWKLHLELSTLVFKLKLLLMEAN